MKIVKGRSHYLTDNLFLDSFQYANKVQGKGSSETGRLMQIIGSETILQAQQIYPKQADLIGAWYYSVVSESWIEPENIRAFDRGVDQDCSGKWIFRVCKGLKVRCAVYFGYDTVHCLEFIDTKGGRCG